MRTLILSNADEWKQYVQHDFVKQLGQGTLSRERFIHFIKCATIPGPAYAFAGLLTKRPPPGRIISISYNMPEKTGMAAPTCSTQVPGMRWNSELSSLLAAKTPAYADVAAAAEVVLAVVKERQMHASFCAQWGVDLAELESTQESSACTAYGAYLIDVGLQDALRGEISFRGWSKFMVTKETVQAFLWR